MTDAQSRGELALNAPEAPPADFNLLTAQIDLPDLLDTEDVAEIAVTPTPLNASLNIDAGANEDPNNSLAGAQIIPPVSEQGNAFPDIDPPISEPATRPAPQVQIQSVVPNQILIDGKPINGGAEPMRVGDQLKQSVPSGFKPSTFSGPLVRAPISGLSRPSPFGLVPAPNAARGQSPLLAYKRPFTAPAAKYKQVSLIVGGLGVNRALTLRAINELPPDVTLSFAAHTNGLQGWIDQARSKGHEVLLELPMEPYNFDPRPASAQYVLRSDVPPAVNIRNLDYLLSRAQGYFGVTNYLGEKFLQTPTANSSILAQLKDSGLGFIHDGTGASITLNATADSHNLSWTQNRAVIDNNPEVSKIRDVLTTLELGANDKTPVLGMGFSYPQTIDAIIAWYEDSAERGMVLAPASAGLNQP